MSAPRSCLRTKGPSAVTGPWQAPGTPKPTPGAHHAPPQPDTCALCLVPPDASLILLLTPGLLAEE